MHFNQPLSAFVPSCKFIHTHLGRIQILDKITAHSEMNHTVFGSSRAGFCSYLHHLRCSGSFNSHDQQTLATMIMSVIDTSEPGQLPLVVTSGSTSVCAFIFNHHPPLLLTVADHLSISHYKRNTDIDSTLLSSPSGH